MYTGEKGKSKNLYAFIGIVLAIIVLLVTFFVIGTGTAVAEVVLNGDSNVTLEYDSSWEDPGATGKYTFPFVDFLNKKAPANSSGAIDTKSLGEQRITYTFDHWGAHSEAVRRVTVVDTTAPEIVLKTNPDYSIKPTEEYEEEGFAATDLCDGDLTDLVERTFVDDKIIYSVTDSSGNTATVERIIPYDYSVEPEPELEAAPEGDPESKFVYLTFDDGPYQYTERLLDILDEYNVKATFFVTAWYGYPEMIGEEVRRGHSVGVHTYFHKYDEIYSSDEAFWADFEKMQDLIEEQTGKRTNLMRFPGGSSNFISVDYNKGIMTRLVKQAEERGYTYFDWNVSSGDAGETTDSDEVAQNIIDGIQDKKHAIVLCHDVKEYTLDAIEKVIVYCMENGYTLLPLTEDGPTAHHEINN